MIDNSSESVVEDDLVSWLGEAELRESLNQVTFAIFAEEADQTGVSTGKSGAIAGRLDPVKLGVGAAFRDQLFVSPHLAHPGTFKHYD